MAKSRLSVSASRALLGLGVIGITASGLSAGNYTGNLEYNTPTITGIDGNVTITDTNVTIGNLGTYKPNNGTPVTITKVTIVSGSGAVDNLIIKGAFGNGYGWDIKATSFNVGNGTDSSHLYIDAGKIGVIQTATALTLKKGSNLTINGTLTNTTASLDFNGNNTFTYGESATGSFKGVNVSGENNTISLGKNFETDTDSGLTFKSGGKLTITGTAGNTPKGFSTKGNAGTVFVDNNTLTLENIKYTDTSGSTVSGTGNSIIMDKNSSFNTKSLTIDSGVNATPSALTISGGKVVISSAVSAGDLSIGATKGSGSLTLSNTDVSVSGGLIMGADASGGNALNIQDGSKLTVKGNATVKGKDNIIYLAGGKDAKDNSLNIINIGGNLVLEAATDAGKDASLTITGGENKQGGTVNITGTTSVKSNTNTKGTLNIQNGVNVNFTGAITVSGAAGQVASFNVKDSAIVKTGDLTIGQANTELNINNATMYIGGAFTDVADAKYNLSSGGNLVFGTDDAPADVALSGGDFNINSGATLKAGVLTASGAKSDFVLDKGNMIIKSLVSKDATHTLTATNKSNIIIKEASTLTKNIKVDLTDSTMRLGGLLKYNENADATLTLKNGSIITGLEGAATNEAALQFVSGSTITLDNSKIDVKTITFAADKNDVFKFTGGKNNEAFITAVDSIDFGIGADKVNVTTDALVTENKSLIKVTGDGAKITGAPTIGKIAYKIDVYDILTENKDKVSKGSYFSTIQVNDDNAGTIANGAADGKDDGQNAVSGSHMGKLLLSNYELAGLGTNELTLQANTNTGTIDSLKMIQASAQDTLNAIESMVDESNGYFSGAQTDIKAAIKSELESMKAGLQESSQAKTMQQAVNGMFKNNQTVNTNVIGNIAQSVADSGNAKVAMGLVTYSGLENTHDAITGSGDTGTAQSIFDSYVRSKVNNDRIINNAQSAAFYSDIISDGESISAMSDASTGVNAAIAVANDMNISNRIAMHSNPYQQLSNAKRFAALNSDAAFDYYDTYKRSVWANVFGGVNIIDSENGGLIGVSAGIDSYLTDNFLLGAHLTYANSTVDDGTNKQKSNSFQLGVYSLYKFAPTWELNTKASIQFAPTDLDNNSKIVENRYSTDFTRTSFNLGANIGKVFSIADGMYLKPFFGGNYYYTYTPGYDRGGDLSKTDDQAASSLSLELGAEFRIYASENAYFYITPKLEQYVLNSVDDFVGSFTGSTVNYTIKGEDEKKLYGQILIGGDYQVNEALSLNAGLGVKQILANKVNDNNETFITGNVGLKYRF